MTKKLIYLTFSLVLFIVSAVLAQVPQPAKPQSKPILVLGATAHIGNGEVIQNAALAFEEGKITIIGDARVLRLDMERFEVIRAEGKHLYPGLILPVTDLGLVEVSSVRATRDASETGDINPNVRSLVAYNTDSEIIGTLRYNGILTAQPTPSGGLFAGTSSVMKLEGWNWEDAVLKADIGVHLEWPSKRFGPRWWLGESESRENPNYSKHTEKVKTFLKESKAYSELDKPAKVNLKMESMRGLFDGSQKLFVHARTALEIMEALELLAAMDIEDIVLVGARDAYHVKEYLKEKNIPVLLDEVHRLPGRAEEAYDMPYRLAAELHTFGIQVALTYPSTQNSRNLPFFAGTTAGFGISKEEALQLVSLNPAKILGIDDRVGSLEEGKDATFVISEGDLLDMRGNRITHAFIEGSEITLDTKQQVLFERFMEKYTEEGRIKR